MSTHIIETVGKWGVKSSPYATRRQQVRPGDVVEFAEDLRQYPVSCRFCRVDHVDRDSGMVGIVNGMGSAFLDENGSLSISGGPFFSVPLESLEPTTDLREERFWNWGDNSPGADQGVDYRIARPVFMATESPNDHQESHGTSETHARQGGTYRYSVIPEGAPLVRSWDAGHDGLTSYLFDLKPKLSPRNQRG